MRNTQAARYARWSAMISLVITLLVGGVYLRHSWEARLSHLAAPPSVPSSVQQQSAAFSFSKEAGNRTQFTVRASRATQYIEGGKGVLDDVWITAYGNDSQRFDNLRTHSCDYIDATGNMTCAGEVQIDLESAEDARRHPSMPSKPNPDARIIHIVTTNVSFDRDTGEATTEQRVKFQFSGMEGEAVGFHYSSGQGEMRLLRDVEITFDGSDSTKASGKNGPAGADATALRVTGGSLEFNRNDRILHLLGPAKADQGAYELAAGELIVELNEQFRARRLLASGHPEMHSAGSQPISVRADEFSAPVSADGKVQRMSAMGNVHSRERSAMGDDQLDADRVDFELSAVGREPRLLTATGNVTAQSGRGDRTSRLATGRMEMTFVPTTKTGEGQSGRTAHVSSNIAGITAPAAIVDIEEPAQPVAGAKIQGAPKPERIHLTSQHLEATFDADNQVQEIHGTEGVKIDRQDGAGAAETSTAREIVARFGSDGAWSNVDETGNVHLQEGESSAQGDRAHFDRVSDTIVLTGSAAVSLIPSERTSLSQGPLPGRSQGLSPGPSDDGSRTTAQSITFRRAANEVVAEGRVATSEMPGATGTVTKSGPGPKSGSESASAEGPEHVSADRLVANTAAEHAVYSGHARLWQGSSLIEADTIEMDSPTKNIVAVNNVRAVFPQAAWTGAPGQALPDRSTSKKAAGQNEFWRVEAGRMTYANNDGRARLEQKVRAHSAAGSIRADAMDLFFNTENSGSGARKTGDGQRQEVTRALAVGHVAIDQGDRHGTGDKGEYTAAEGKFVLSGGPPSVHDDLGNTTSGRELTLFLADDKILVDSADGLRTRTTHRVEK